MVQEMMYDAACYMVCKHVTISVALFKQNGFKCMTDSLVGSKFVQMHTLHNHNPSGACTAHPDFNERLIGRLHGWSMNRGH